MNRTKVYRTSAAAMIAALLCLFVLGTVRYSTLIESMLASPNVSEWAGPADFRLGTSPDCAGHPCWVERDIARDGWEALDIPKVYLKEKLRPSVGQDLAYYRFAVTIPKGLQDSGDVVAFSPNWVVHKSFQIYVDGQWVGAGHGVTPSGDIVYQKVIVPLPQRAVANGSALVTIVAEVGPEDLGIQHLGKILVGPATTLGKLHVEAEFAMGSYYLLFMTAEGALCAFFGLFYLLARTRKGFGAFVVYAFLSTVIHLSIGNFLEGLVPLSTRIWLYFGAKAGATSVLGALFGTILWRRIPRRWIVWSTLPMILATGLLADFAFGSHRSDIALMHTTANVSLFVMVATFLALSLLRPGSRRDVAAFTAGYLAVLTWIFFVHHSQDFDYRPLADLGFFYFVAWLTLSEFGTIQARAKIMDRNWLRLQAMFQRLLGKRLATHLTVRGDLNERGRVDATVMVFDFKYTNRMIRSFGVDQTLAAVDEFLSLVGRAVEVHGGEVNKIIGDKLLAVWGLAGASSEHATEAARAGLAVREAMHTWNTQRATAGLTPVGSAAAMASGSVVVGRLGSGERIDYGIFGAAVGRAFELLQHAKDQAVDIVLDIATWNQLGECGLAQPFDLDMGDEAFILIGLVEKGVLRVGDARWQERFGHLEAGGRVFDAGANQDLFIQDVEDRHAA